jgi:hypothetical protein
MILWMGGLESACRNGNSLGQEKLGQISMDFFERFYFLSSYGL